MEYAHIPHDLVEQDGITNHGTRIASTFRGRGQYEIFGDQQWHCGTCIFLCQQQTSHKQLLLYPCTCASFLPVQELKLLLQRAIIDLYYMYVY